MTALGMRTPVLYLTVSSMSYGDSYFPSLCKLSVLQFHPRNFDVS